MKNFYRLDQGINVSAAVAQIMTHPELWNQNTLRTTYPNGPHSEVDDIWMRFNVIDPDNPYVAIDDVEAVNYPAWSILTQARALVMSLMAHVQGERLGRVIITRLKPGGHITPHPDMGAPAEYYKRFHIVLQGLPGSIFRAGDEQVSMQTGECWWFDNSQVHEVLNNSADDRLHVIVDIRVS